jgi:hypothetical protein
LTCTNPFSTREPEPPDTTGNIQGFEDARDTDQLLNNFERAIEEKNITEYINCFANPDVGHQKSFRFVPEPGLVDYFLDPWSLRDEENYFRKMTEEQRVDFPRLTFNTLDEPVFQPLNLAAPDDSMETNIFRYQLTVAEVDTQKIYTGQMKLRVFQSRSTDSNWYIYHWNDYAIDENFESSWSFLKFENR